MPLKLVCENITNCQYRYKIQHVTTVIICMLIISSDLNVTVSNILIYSKHN